jgi:hypothetical protein
MSEYFLDPEDRLTLFWNAPEGAGNIISLKAQDGKVYAECEHGLFEILPDGSSVGVLS